MNIDKVTVFYQLREPNNTAMPFNVHPVEDAGFRL
jgi:hypothetical protein